MASTHLCYTSICNDRSEVEVVNSSLPIEIFASSTTDYSPPFQATAPSYAGSLTILNWMDTPALPQALDLGL